MSSTNIIKTKNGSDKCARIEVCEEDELDFISRNPMDGCRNFACTFKALPTLYDYLTEGTNNGWKSVFEEIEGKQVEIEFLCGGTFEQNKGVMRELIPLLEKKSNFKVLVCGAGMHWYNQQFKGVSYDNILPFATHNEKKNLLHID